MLGAGGTSDQMTEGRGRPGRPGCGGGMLIPPNTLGAIARADAVVRGLALLLLERNTNFASLMLGLLLAT